MIKHIWYWFVALLHTSTTFTVTVPTPYHLQKKRRTGYKKPKGSRPWSSAEDSFLTEKWNNESVNTLSLVIDRTPAAIRSRAYTLGLTTKGQS